MTVTFCYTSTLLLVADFLTDLLSLTHPSRLTNRFSTSCTVLRRHIAWLPSCQVVGVRLARSCTESSVPGEEGWFHMRTKAYLLSVALVCGLASLTIPVTSRPAETIQRTVQGTVVATDVTVDPPTIVVQVLLPHNEALVVGARVPTDARIVRGKQAARLADVKVGEKADITYVKTADGLIARSVHLR